MFFKVAINIDWLGISWLGRICFVAMWLAVGTQPHFKDKRTPEHIAKDDEAAEQQAEKGQKQIPSARKREIKM